MTASTDKKKLARAELTRRLSAMVPKVRLDAMLEEVDGRALVRSLPGEDVYSTIVDVGLADATDVVQLSTAEQFRTYVDLAAWQKDRMDPLETLRWLRAARGDDADDFIKKVKALDIEVIELLFKKLTTVHDLEENPDANPEGVAFETPEGRYLVEMHAEGADLAALRQLSMDLMAQSPFELSRFLEAVRWELPTELEETAHQFRAARLADLGFPPLEEAIKLFAWVDPAKFTPAPPASAPQALVPGASAPDFVAAAFTGLQPDERDTLSHQVRYLVNSALVAEGAEPGDPQAIRRISEQARDYLNLSLEHLTGGDPGRSADVLREHPLKTVFQVGFSLTLKLKREVERLARESGSKFGDTWLALDDESAALAALLRRRPLKALKVPGAEPVPFRTRRELLDSEALLQRVRLQREVFAALLGPNVAETVARFSVSLAELTPQRLFIAVAARAELDGVVAVEPFPEGRVGELPERLKSASQAVQVLAARVPAAAAEVKVMVEKSLSVLNAELLPLLARHGAVDPKLLTCLPVAGQVTL